MSSLNKAKCDPEFDTRLIAVIQLMRLSNGEGIQPIIAQWVGPDGKVDDSKVGVLLINGYQVFDKENLVNAYVGYTRSDT